LLLPLKPPPLIKNKYSSGNTSNGQHDLNTMNVSTFACCRSFEFVNIET
jgi:hypothetical protein